MRAWIVAVAPVMSEVAHAQRSSTATVQAGAGSTATPSAGAVGPRDAVTSLPIAADGSAGIRACATLALGTGTVAPYGTGTPGAGIIVSGHRLELPASGSTALHRLFPRRRLRAEPEPAGRLDDADRPLRSAPMAGPIRGAASHRAGRANAVGDRATRRLAWVLAGLPLLCEAGNAPPAASGSSRPVIGSTAAAPGSNGVVRELSLPDAALNATDAPYGATLDGTTNDGPALTALFAALPKGKPGIVALYGIPGLAVQVGAQGADPYCLTLPSIAMPADTWPGRLPCTLIRPTKITKQTFGWGDNGAVFSIIGDSTGDGQAGIGPAPADVQAGYPTKDAVGLFVQEQSLPPVWSGSATFTATTAGPATALGISTLSRMRLNMWIEATDGAGIVWDGPLTGWATDGSSVTVAGWYRVGVRGAGTPASGTGTIAINAHTKVWGQNIDVTLTPDGYARLASGIEITMTNQLRDFDPVTLTNAMTGFDVYAQGDLGAYGHVARGNLYEDFEAEPGANTVGGFHVSAAGSPTYGFWAEQTRGSFLAEINGGQTVYRVGVDGSMSLGSAGHQGTFYLNGNGLSAYDVALQASGGNGTPGQGSCRS